MSKHTSPYVGNSARGQRDYVRQYGDDRRVDKHKAIANGRLEKGRKRKHFELEASTSDQSTKKQKQEPSNKRKREEDIADGEDGETHPPAAKKLVTNDDRIQVGVACRSTEVILILSCRCCQFPGGLTSS